MAADRTVFPDVDKRTERRGSAKPTPGLNSLDQQREASLADEGGAAAAVVEGDLADVASEGEASEEEETPGEIGLEGLVIGAGLLAAAAFLWWRGR